MDLIVIVEYITAQQALDLKHQLDQDQLRIDQDYSWSYSPVKYNDWGQDNGSASYARFEFSTGALASFYRLKWAK